MLAALGSTVSGTAMHAHQKDAMHHAILAAYLEELVVSQHPAARRINAVLANVVQRLGGHGRRVGQAAAGQQLLHHHAHAGGQHILYMHALQVSKTGVHESFSFNTVLQCTGKILPSWHSQ